jgi:hypothetical protein
VLSAKNAMLVLGNCGMFGLNKLNRIGPILDPLRTFASIVGLKYNFSSLKSTTNKRLVKNYLIVLNKYFGAFICLSV